MPEILLSVIVPAIITAVVSLWMGRKQNRKIQVDIESQYQSMLSREIDEREKLSKRFDILEKEAHDFKEEARKWRRAYYLSVGHIRRIDPLHPVPDFLEWSTDQLQRYYREHYPE